MKQTNPLSGYSAVQKLTLLGILAAMTIVLSVLESWLPSLPIPGARLGLANIAVMTTLTLLGLPAAFAVTAVKILCVLLTRGVTAALMTGAGTLLAVLLMAALLPLYPRRLTFVGVGVAGAVAHNAGQLLCALWLLGDGVWFYAPLLLACGLAAGTVTGLLLNLVLPRIPFDRMAARP